MGLEAKPGKGRFWTNRVVVLCGPDCSGKTTLAEGLAKVYDTRIVKGLRVDSDKVYDKVKQDLAAWKNQPQEDLILLDRWQFPDDIIYERVHGRAESQLVPHIEELIEECLEIPIMFVHVTALPQVLKRRYEQRGDEEVDFDMILKAHRAYGDFFGDLKAMAMTRKHCPPLPVLHIDTSLYFKSDALVRVIERIDKFYTWGEW